MSIPTGLRVAVLACAAILMAAAPAAADDYRAADPTMSIRGTGSEKAPGPGGVHIDWTTGDGQAGQLYRSDDGRPAVPVGITAGSGYIDLPGIPAGSRAEFRLKQVGLVDKVLATATVQNGKSDIRILTRTTPPPHVPSWVNRVMQLVPFATLLLFGVLGLLYLRSLRGLRAA